MSEHLLKLCVVCVHAIDPGIAWICKFPSNHKVAQWLTVWGVTKYPFVHASRFKKKAWHFGTLTAANLKASMSANGGVTDFKLDAASGGKAGSKSPKHERKVKSAYRASAILDALQSEVDMDLARHTINEAKLAKLHSILNVLRESEDRSDAEVSEQRPKRPEFLSVFDPGNGTDDHTKTLPSGVKKRKKRSKLSKAVLRVLHEGSADLSSDSGDNLEDGPPSSTLNRQSEAWLQARKYDHSDNRPRSDSFQAIPSLRQSLNAGRINKVSTYTFDEHSPKKHPPPGHIHNLKHKVSSEGSSAVPGQSHVTSHYTVVDTRSQMEEDSPSQQDAIYSSPVCKHYSVPVEISVHRISVKDVDEPPEIEIGRAKSFDVGMKRKEAQELLAFKQKMLTREDKPRSRSMGDAYLLESDDEVLLVRTPVANRSPADSPAVNRRSVAHVPASPGAREVTSLDFGVCAQRHSRSFIGHAGRNEGDDITQTWERVRRNVSFPKSKSLDDLSDSGTKTKSK